MLMKPHIKFEYKKENPQNYPIRDFTRKYDKLNATVLNHK